MRCAILQPQTSWLLTLATMAAWPYSAACVCVLANPHRRISKADYWSTSRKRAVSRWRER